MRTGVVKGRKNEENIVFSNKVKLTILLHGSDIAKKRLTHQIFCLFFQKNPFCLSAIILSLISLASFFELMMYLASDSVSLLKS